MNSKNSLWSKTARNNLKLIKNLSNYLIFLASDLTNFCNFRNDNFQLTLNKCEINIEKSINFCFEILKALLYCQESKIGINPILEYDSEIIII